MIAGVSLVSSLADLAKQLGDLVARENIVLRERRPRDLAASQEEKDRLTGTYETQVASIRRNPSVLKSADPKEVDRLKTAMKYFQAQLEEHRRAVQAAKSVAERMLTAITEQVGGRQRTVQAYNRGAVMQPAFQAPAARVVPLTLNQVV